MIPLASLSLTVGITLVVGLLLTLALHRFDIKHFFHSSLAVKIALWIPIYIVFVALLLSPWPVIVAFYSFIIWITLRELTYALPSANRALFFLYWLILVACLLQSALFPAAFGAQAVRLLIGVAIASVYSDVLAFFAGNTLGRHKLPAALNPRKSYEGVAGQLLGALLGVLIVRTFVLPELPFWLWLPVGIGSALGDLLNSYFKRRADIKDWGNSLPGHGGFLDRLSSLSVAFALSFYFLLIVL